MGKKRKEKAVLKGKPPREKYREELVDYIEEVVRNYVTMLPGVILMYRTVWEDKKENEKGGFLSTIYQPLDFSATFYIYDGVFDEIPEKGLTEGFKAFIKYCIAHEIGHCLIWELDGKFGTEERVATILGSLLMRLYDYEYERGGG